MYASADRCSGKAGETLGIHTRRRASATRYSAGYSTSEPSYCEHAITQGSGVHVVAGGATTTAAGVHPALRCPASSAVVRSGLHQGHSVGAGTPGGGPAQSGVDRCADRAPASVALPHRLRACLPVVGGTGGGRTGATVAAATLGGCRWGHVTVLRPSHDAVSASGGDRGLWGIRQGGSTIPN